MAKSEKELKGIVEKGEETPLNKDRIHEHQFPGEDSLLNGNERERQAFEDQMSMTGSEERQDPGDRVVKDFRELSRQQGPQDEKPSFLKGENVQQQEDGPPRYGDSISKNADKEFRDNEKEYSSDSHNDRNYQSDGRDKSSKTKTVSSSHFYLYKNEACTTECKPLSVEKDP